MKVQALIFTLLKYLEIGIMSISMLIVARAIGPEQMGIAMPIFLFITYSNYLNLGAGQLILKYFSIESSDKYIVIVVAAKVLVFSTVAALLIAICLLERQFAVPVGLVSCCILTRSVMLANLRASNQYRKININNIAVSLVMLFGSIYFVSDVTGLVTLQLVVNILSVFLYSVSDMQFAREVIYSLGRRIRMEMLRFYLVMAIKLSAIGLFTTLLLSLDKLILQLFSFTNNQYGVYQLSDNISNLIYIGLTTLLFFLYPRLIGEIRSSIVFLNRYLNAQLLILPLYLFGLIVLWYASIYVELYIFPDYSGLSDIIVYTSAFKVSIFQMSLMSVVFIARDNELYMIRVLVSTVLLVIFSVLVAEWYYKTYEMQEILLFAIFAINMSYMYVYAKERKKTGN